MTDESLIEAVETAIEKAGDKFCEASGINPPGTFNKIAAEAAIQAHTEWLEANEMTIARLCDVHEG